MGGSVRNHVGLARAGDSRWWTDEGAMLLQPLGAIVSIQLRAVAVVRLVLSQYSILAGILAAQLGIGGLNGLMGPSLLHLSAQVGAGSSMHTAAAIIAARASGQLVGVTLYASFLTAVDPLAVICGSCFGSALCTVVVPPSSSPALLMVLLARMGLFIGVLDCACLQGLATRTSNNQDGYPAAGAQSTISSRWQLGMQIAMAGGGALVGLCLLMLLGENRAIHATSAAPDVLRAQLATSFHAAYWLVGSHLICTSLLFLALSVIRRLTKMSIEVPLQPQHEHSNRPPPQLPTAVSCLLLLAQSGGETGFGLLLFVYASLCGLEVSPAVLLCTVFWGALAVGRPLGLMMLDIFSRRQLLCCNTIGAGLSLSWLLVRPTSQVFWFCAAAGFGLSIAGNVPSTMSQVCAQSGGQLGGRTSWAAKGSCEVGELVIAPLLCWLGSWGSGPIMWGQLLLLGACAVGGMADFGDVDLQPSRILDEQEQLIGPTAVGPELDSEDEASDTDHEQAGRSLRRASDPLMSN